MATRKTTPWSVEEVQTFLGLVADERIQRELDGATRNEKVYQEVSELLAADGYQRTFQQCREKLKKLKSDYRSIKDHNGRSGSYRKSWKWFDQMDAIYGHRPVSNGREGGLDPATALLEPLTEDDDVSISEEGSMTLDDAPLVPAAAPTRAASSANMTPQRVFTGKRKRQQEQEHMTVLKEMQAADVEQQELTRAQRERHLQMALDDAVQARELEAALRREENAEAAAFNQAFLATLSQLVQALSGRRDPVPPSKHGAQLGPAAAPTPATSSANMTPQRVFTGNGKQEHVTVLKEMQAADVEQQELTRAQRERHLQMALDDAVQARELEAALRREENAEAAAFNQAFLATLSQLVQASSSRRDPVPPPLD
ncbi:zinc finger and SCAN domain-containing protein 29-like [Anguilla anguilla]|uniref:zinc finger and SCAN domain-containing protein 29-like n=1 Tax=Anguilla anguilla TaxID=7936 RepID=UPI0015B1A668|nr:zinc finger and SCAN domain-containing protein 29-like [Anguilla anguilla]